MNIHIGRSELDSIIDTLGWDIDTRELLRKAVYCFGEEILDPFIEVHRGYLTSASRNYKFHKPQYIAAPQITEDLQQMLSDTFLPAQLSGRWTALNDVPPGFRASAEKFAHKFRAPRTLQRRYSSWKKILRLCLQHGACPLPMSVDTASGLVAYIADSGVGLADLKAARDCIVFVHRYKELPDPTDHPRFKRVWAGIVRVLGSENPNRKWALTRDEVGRMITLARKAGREDQAVALAVGFEGALRSTELCNLRIEHVHVNGNRARIFVGSSKTDQTGRGEWVDLELRANAPFDASAMLISWLKRLGRSEGYLFVNVRDGRLTQEPIDARTVTRMIKSLVAKLGDLSPSRFASHSLRAGWITEELSLNRPLAEIAAHVRHSSTAMLLRYFRPRTAPRNFVRYASNGKNP
jgi:integrase